MSSIDNRIVRMQFDNEDFERGVMQSMRTIDALNEKLQFKEADKGISALQVHLNNVDFSGMSNAIQHIEHSFTSMTGMVAQHIKSDIVDSVIDAAKKLEQMTLGQIKSGGRARAQNIANAKFMIEGLKFDWEAVRQAADYAVTDTAYGLDAAAKAASQLAASGVDFMETIEEVNGTKLTQMHKSLRAISGVAAMTNSSYEEIAHIFTAVAGMGKLTAMQMNQLSLRGLNIASTIAEQTGKTEQEIREMVSKGMIDFQMFSEAMDNAYGEHAKEANKTFEGSLSNLKAALSRIGAIFQQPVIDKTNTFFVAVTGRIKEFQKALNDDTALRLTSKGIEKVNKQLKEEQKNFKGNAQAAEAWSKQRRHEIEQSYLDSEDALKRGDVEKYSIARFATHFAEAWEAGINFISKVTESLDLSWFQSIGSFLDNSAKKVTKFFNAASTAIDKVKASVDKTSTSIADSLELDMNDLDLLHRILKNEFGYVEERWAKLDEIYKEQGSTKTGLWLQGYMDQLAGVGYRFEELGWTEEEFKKKQEDLAKSEAQRVKELSKEEVMINGLGYAFYNAKLVLDYTVTTIKNVLKAFGNLIAITARVVWYLQNIGISFNPWTIAEKFSILSEAILHLTEAVEPSRDTLVRIGEVAEDVGYVLGKVRDIVFDGATAFIEYVAACISADESLDDLAKNESLTALQRTTLNLLRILNNVWRFLKAIGKIAVKIAKSIGTAFQNVFGGEQFGRGLALISGGIQGITDGIATAAEKIADAEVPFTILETLFGTIFMIVNKVLNVLTDFTAAVRKTVNGTEDAADATDNLAKKGKKGITFLDTLGKYVGKAIIWLKELPGKIETVWEALKETEGFKHLETSFKNLKKQALDFYDRSINPMTKGLDEVATRAGGTGDTLLGKLADGIGIVADKVAGFMDKLPEYGKKIQEFFTKAKEWVDKTIGDLGLDKMGQSIATAFGDLFSGDESIFKKVKKFAEDVFFTIVDGLSGVDWKGVGKGGILALVAANLFNFFKITGNVNTMIKGVAGLPAQIGNFMKGLGGVFKTAQTSMERASKAYLFTAIAQSVVAVAGAIILLKDIPKDDLNKALAALLMIGVIMLASGKAIGYILYGTKGDKLKNACNNIDNSTKALVQVNNSMGRFIGVALLIASIAGGIWLVAKSVGVLKDALKGIELQSDIKHIQGFLKFFAILFVSIAGIGIIATKFFATKDAALTLIGIAALIAAIGGSLLAVAASIKIISSIPVIRPEAIGIIAGTLVVLGVLIVAITKSMQDVSVLSCLGVVAILAVMGVVIGAIVLEVVALAAIMTGSEVLGLTANSDNIMTAAKVICGIVIALGAAMFLIGKGLNKMEKPSALIFVIAGMSAVILSVAFLFKTLNTIAQETSTNTLAVMVLGMIAIIGLIASALDKCLKHVQFVGSDEGAKNILSIGIAFIMIGASLMIIAKAAESFSKVDLLKGIVPALGFLVIIVFVLKKIMDALSQAKDLDAISTAIQSVSVAFIALGGAMLLIALAAEKFAALSTGALVLTGVVLVVLTALFGVLAYFSAKNPDGMGKAAQVMLSIGVAFLFLGASILLAGIGMGLVVSGLGKLAEGIGILALAVREHWPTVILIVGLVAVLAILIARLIDAVEPAAPVIADVATTVFGVVKAALTGLGNLLKGGKDKFVKWWKNLQPGLKVMIASGIVTVCGAILKASPEVLATIKKLIWKVLDFLIDIVPTLVDKLFNLLIKLINSLADTIRSKAALIAAAFWNLMESLLEVIFEVINQLILLLVGDGKIGKAVTGVFTEAKGRMRAHVEEIKQYAETADEAANQVSLDYLKMDANAGSSEAAKALEEMEGKLSDVGDAADSTEGSVFHLASTFDKYKNIASDKVRVNGVPIEIPRNVVNDEGKIVGSQFSDGMLEGMDINADDFDMSKITGMVGGEGADSVVAGYTEEMDESHSEFYDTTDEAIQDGPVAAIQDSEVDISRATDKHIVGPMNQQVRDSRGRVKQNMYYAMQGGAEGIEDAYPLIDGSIAELVKRMKSDFVGPLKINSPSKVFMDYGGYIIQGLINGINSTMPAAEGTVGSLSDTIINTFGDPLNYISKIVSGELQVDPSIQPVLDTSRIARGSASVRALLNGQAVSIGGLSGQIAADIGELDSRNFDIVMEIRALREDMATMNDELANMQVVMDTGALVGATASSMDKALGQRAVRFGRGN